MFCRLFSLLLLAHSLLPAVIIDQIAIIVGNSIVKDSDIDRDIRVTSFLNSQPLNLSNAARKTAGNRLIDQIFIRKEIQLGDYPAATFQQADQELARLEQEKFNSEAALQNGLRTYGITAPDLRFHFQWQLTVLRFVDLRFRPATIVTDEQIQKYYDQHLTALRQEHPGKYTLGDVRQEVESVLAAEQVNQLFFAWLDQQRKETKISYLEENLQ